MRMRTSITIMAAFSLMLAACGGEGTPPSPDTTLHFPHVSAIDHPFEVLPSSSAYAIRVASLDRAQKDADAFLKTTLGNSIAEIIEDFLLRGGDLSDRMGLDAEQPLWGVEFVAPEGARELVVLYPMQDQGLFLTRQGARIAREGVYRFGGRYVFLQHRYAVIAREPFAESVEAWLADEDALPRLLTLNPPDSAALWTRNQEMLHAYSEKGIDALIQNLDGPALLIAAPLIMAALSWTDELFAQTEYAEIALSASEEAAQLRKRVAIQPDTPLAALLSQHQPASPMISTPPLVDRAVIRGTFNLDPGLLEDARQRIMADLAIFGVKNEPIDEFWEAMRQAWDGAIVGAVDLTGEPAWLLSVRDETAARHFIERCVESVPGWLSPLLDMQEVALDAEHIPVAGEFHGTAYGSIHFRFLTHDPEVDLPDEFSYIPTAIQYAFTPNGLLLTTGDIARLLLALNAKGEMQPGDAERASLLTLELDAINLLEAVKRSLVARAAIINPLATLSIPPLETAPIRWQVSAHSDEFVSTFTIPAESLKTAMDVFFSGGAPIHATENLE